MLDTYKEIRERFIKNETVREVYEARWVWYHTLLSIELFILIILQVAILIKI